MLKNKKWEYFFHWGVSTVVKGFAHFSVFVMGKLRLRSLGQFLVRKLHSKNIHIGYFIIDRGIEKQTYGYEMIHPDTIAKT
jgi:hypothetical protein